MGFLRRAGFFVSGGQFSERDWVVVVGKQLLLECEETLFIGLTDIHGEDGEPPHAQIPAGKIFVQLHGAAE